MDQLVGEIVDQVERDFRRNIFFEERKKRQEERLKQIAAEHKQKFDNAELSRLQGIELALKREYVINYMKNWHMNHPPSQSTRARIVRGLEKKSQNVSSYDY